MYLTPFSSLRKSTLPLFRLRRSLCTFSHRFRGEEIVARSISSSLMYLCTPPRPCKCFLNINGASCCPSSWRSTLIRTISLKRNHQVGCKLYPHRPRGPRPNCLKPALLRTDNPQLPKRDFSITPADRATG